MLASLNIRDDCVFLRTEKLSRLSVGYHASQVYSGLEESSRIIFSCKYAVPYSWNVQPGSQNVANVEGEITSLHN